MASTDPDREVQESVERLFDHPLRRWFSAQGSYQLTRFVVLRLLGALYFIGFLIVLRQGDALIGADGLLPAPAFLDRVAAALGSRAAGFARLPSLFWLGCSDGAMQLAAWVGLLLAGAVCLGLTNALAQLLLWALYMSFVHVGQVFYGYGWEIQLLETGFLAVFLCPMRSVRPFPATAPPMAVIWLLRWLIFRVMIGAGLIKMRGDPCWRDLTCLFWHYETQPLPNPVSWLLHQAPSWFHRVGVIWNHVVELLVPVFALSPRRRARTIAGVLLVAFQGTLIVSGNLSFLNWLTIVPALACFDDGALARIVPARLRARVVALAPQLPTSRPHRWASWGLAGLVALLSVGPVCNLISPRQTMNRSFDPLALVNTYGAFGGVGKQRFEVVLMGTRDEVLGEGTEWLEYELPCKPGDVRRRPCVVSPYHHRLDWQIWFAAMGSYEQHPWLVHLAYKLLRGERPVRRLLARDPFADGRPRYLRAELYRYELTRLGDGSGAWWRRTRVSEYLRPVSLDDPDLIEYLAARGWLRDD
jgi:hypothetical protein